MKNQKCVINIVKRHHGRSRNHFYNNTCGALARFGGDRRSSYVHVSSIIAIAIYFAILFTVAASDRVVPILDLNIGRVICNLRGHSDFVMACHWSEKYEHTLATAGLDSQVYVWDMRNVKHPLCSRVHTNTDMYHRFRGFISVRFSYDGHTVFAFSRTNIFIAYDIMADERLVSQLTGKLDGKLSNPFPIIFGLTHTSNPPLAFLPYGEAIIVIDTSTGQTVRELRKHFGNVNAAVYNPFHNELYTAGNDPDILIWKPPIEHREALECLPRE
jgi:hypothetical protein